MRQEQFLHVVPPEEAARRWSDAIGPLSPRVKRLPLHAALGRVLAEDVVAVGDVPAFDRSNLDGFAVRAQDTFGAEDEAPRRLVRLPETLVPGPPPPVEVGKGTAAAIATGAVIPRGADAIVPVEHTDLSGEYVLVRRPVVPGAGLSAAGSDVARGETVLRTGTVLTSRETGTLAACGFETVSCFARPRVAVLSTGGELVPPGARPTPGSVHDANGRILSDAVREIGGEPLSLEIVPDDAARLRAALERAVAEADVVLISGGTSKGGGDLVPAAVQALGPPGLVVHGVDVKPGKPLGLAVARGVPIALLPGFPTSAVFTFHEVVAPLLRRMAGRASEERASVRARMPRRVTKERGRTEYLLVFLVEAPPDTPGPRYVAHPMGKGSGSVTAFARADGFVRIPSSVEYVEKDEVVDVTLLGREVRPADLVVIGSHCTGLDLVLGRLALTGISSRTAFVGSTAGLEAAGRGECDVAGIHLLDPATGAYNVPFLPKGVSLIPGWIRRQGIVFRRGDRRFEHKDVKQALTTALADPTCRLQGRNRGSGTRLLLDRLLAGATPLGHASESRSHHAVAAAVGQGRADWGLCLEDVARGAGLGFLFVAEERFDLAVPDARRGRPPLRALEASLASPETRAALDALGFRLP